MARSRAELATKLLELQIRGENGNELMIDPQDFDGSHGKIFLNLGEGARAALLKEGITTDELDRAGFIQHRNNPDEDRTLDTAAVAKAAERFVPGGIVMGGVRETK